MYRAIASIFGDRVQSKVGQKTARRKSVMLRKKRRRPNCEMLKNLKSHPVNEQRGSEAALSKRYQELYDLYTAALDKSKQLEMREKQLKSRVPTQVGLQVQQPQSPKDSPRKIAALHAALQGKHCISKDKDLDVTAKRTTKDMPMPEITNKLIMIF